MLPAPSKNSPPGLVCGPGGELWQRARTTCTVEGMHVVIATAEPRAAYHIAPLIKAAGKRRASITHLVPYPEPVQGTPWPATTSNPAVLASADRVVITGGTLSAWTALIVGNANSTGLPVRFVELATIGDDIIDSRPKIEAASAVSQHGAKLLAARFNLPPDRVRITGTPLLDEIPAWRPSNRRCTIFSTVNYTERDPKRELLTVARQLKAQGWTVVVRCHPREDTSTWEEFELCEAAGPAESVAASRFMVGYPGTGHAIAAATGCPVLCLLPSNAGHELFSGQLEVLPYWASTAQEVIAMLPGITSAPRERLELAVGPIGGAAERIVGFMLER